MTTVSIGHKKYSFTTTTTGRDQTSTLIVCSGLLATVAWASTQTGDINNSHSYLALSSIILCLEKFYICTWHFFMDKESKLLRVESSSDRY